MAGHVPKQHQDVAGLWSRKWFLDRARAFGPATVSMIEKILDRPKTQAQAFLDCQNVLEGVGKNNRQRLEASCQQILNQHGYPTYTTLKRLMASMNSDNQQASPPLPAPPNTNRPPTGTAAGERADAHGREHLPSTTAAPKDHRTLPRTAELHRRSVAVPVFPRRKRADEN